MGGNVTESQHQLLDQRVGFLERAMGEIKDSMAGIDDSLRTLTTLQVQHAETNQALGRVFDEITAVKTEQDKQDDRMKLLEIAVPGIKETTDMIKRGVFSLCGVIVFAAILVALGIKA